MHIHLVQTKAEAAAEELASKTEETEETEETEDKDEANHVWQSAA